MRKTEKLMAFPWPRQTTSTSTQLIVEDDREHYGEQRFFAIGQLKSGQIVALAYTYREDEVRPISLRNATPKERRWHEG
jgi:uncharacterized DUF497 family protein